MSQAAAEPRAEESAPEISLAVGPPGGRFVTRTELAWRAFYWLTWLSTRRRTALSAGVLRELDALGLGAVALVVASSLLVGLIAVFQVAYQLAPYDAEAMSVRSIAWFAARELGPVVAALLVVARSSAAIAGELASMTANVEVDALRAMGLDPVKYLVAPKLAALLLSLPVLTAIAIALTMAGGWVGSTVFLGYTSSFYHAELQESFAARDLAVGLGKSIAFAVIICLVAADEGLRVQRHVGAIGEAATRAVVFSLLGVLAADTVVNAAFYFIPVLA